MFPEIAGRKTKARRGALGTEQMLKEWTDTQKQVQALARTATHKIKASNLPDYFKVCRLKQIPDFYSNYFLAFVGRVSGDAAAGFLDKQTQSLISENSHYHLIANTLSERAEAINKTSEFLEVVQGLELMNTGKSVTVAMRAQIGQLLKQAKTLEQIKEIENKQTVGLAESLLQLRSKTSELLTNVTQWRTSLYSTSELSCLRRVRIIYPHPQYHINCLLVTLYDLDFLHHSFLSKEYSIEHGDRNPFFLLGGLLKYRRQLNELIDGVMLQQDNENRYRQETKIILEERPKTEQEVQKEVNIYKQRLQQLKLMKEKEASKDREKKRLPYQKESGKDRDKESQLRRIKSEYPYDEDKMSERDKDKNQPKAKQPQSEHNMTELKKNISSIDIEKLLLRRHKSKNSSISKLSSRREGDSANPIDQQAEPDKPTQSNKINNSTPPGSPISKPKQTHSKHRKNAASTISAYPFEQKYREIINEKTILQMELKQAKMKNKKYEQLMKKVERSPRTSIVVEEDFRGQQMPRGINGETNARQVDSVSRVESVYGNNSNRKVKKQKSKKETSSKYRRLSLERKKDKQSLSRSPSSPQKLKAEKSQGAQTGRKVDSSREIEPRSGRVHDKANRSKADKSSVYEKQGSKSGRHVQANKLIKQQPHNVTVLESKLIEQQEERKTLEKQVKELMREQTRLESIINRADKPAKNKPTKHKLSHSLNLRQQEISTIINDKQSLQKQFKEQKSQKNKLEKLLKKSQKQIIKQSEKHQRDKERYEQEIALMKSNMAGAKQERVASPKVQRSRSVAGIYSNQVFVRKNGTPTLAVDQRANEEEAIRKGLERQIRELIKEKNKLQGVLQRSENKIIKDRELNERKVEKYQKVIEKLKGQQQESKKREKQEVQDQQKGDQQKGDPQKGDMKINRSPKLNMYSNPSKSPGQRARRQKSLVKSANMLGSRRQSTSTKEIPIIVEFDETLQGDFDGMQPLPKKADEDQRSSPSNLKSVGDISIIQTRKTIQIIYESQKSHQSKQSREQPDQHPKPSNKRQPKEKTQQDDKQKKRDDRIDRLNEKHKESEDNRIAKYQQMIYKEREKKLQLEKQMKEMKHNMYDLFELKMKSEKQKFREEKAQLLQKISQEKEQKMIKEKHLMTQMKFLKKMEMKEKELRSMLEKEKRYRKQKQKELVYYMENKEELMTIMEIDHIKKSIESEVRKELNLQEEGCQSEGSEDHEPNQIIVNQIKIEEARKQLYEELELMNDDREEELLQIDRQNQKLKELIDRIRDEEVRLLGMIRENMEIVDEKIEKERSRLDTGNSREEPSRGLESRGLESRGLESRGLESRGYSRGLDSRGQSRGHDSRGLEDTILESRAGESKGGQSKGRESRGAESRELRGQEPQGVEFKRAESMRLESRGRESREMEWKTSKSRGAGLRGEAGSRGGSLNREQSRGLESRGASRGRESNRGNYSQSYQQPLGQPSIEHKKPQYDMKTVEKIFQSRLQAQKDHEAEMKAFYRDLSSNPLYKQREEVELTIQKYLQNPHKYPTSSQPRYSPQQKQEISQGIIKRSQQARDFQRELLKPRQIQGFVPTSEDNLLTSHLLNLKRVYEKQDASSLRKELFPEIQEKEQESSKQQLSFESREPPPPVSIRDHVEVHAKKIASASKSSKNFLAINKMRVVRLEQYRRDQQRQAIEETSRDRAARSIKRKRLPSYMSKRMQESIEKDIKKKSGRVQTEASRADKSGVKAERSKSKETARKVKGREMGREGEREKKQEEIEWNILSDQEMSSIHEHQESEEQSDCNRKETKQGGKEQGMQKYKGQQGQQGQQDIKEEQEKHKEQKDPDQQEQQDEQSQPQQPAKQSQSKQQDQDQQPEQNRNYSSIDSKLLTNNNQHSSLERQRRLLSEQIKSFQDEIRSYISGEQKFNMYQHFVDSAELEPYINDLLDISSDELKKLNNNPTFLSDVLKHRSLFILIAKDYRTGIEIGIGVFHIEFEEGIYLCDFLIAHNMRNFLNLIFNFSRYILTIDHTVNKIEYYFNITKLQDEVSVLHFLEFEEKCKRLGQVYMNVEADQMRKYVLRRNLFAPESEKDGTNASIGQKTGIEFDLEVRVHSECMKQQGYGFQNEKKSEFTAVTALMADYLYRDEGRLDTFRRNAEQDLKFRELLLTTLMFQKKKISIKNLSMSLIDTSDRQSINHKLSSQFKIEDQLHEMQLLQFKISHELAVTTRRCTFNLEGREINYLIHEPEDGVITKIQSANSSEVGIFMGLVPKYKVLMVEANEFISMNQANPEINVFFYIKHFVKNIQDVKKEHCLRVFLPEIHEQHEFFHRDLSASTGSAVFSRENIRIGWSTPFVNSVTSNPTHKDLVIKKPFIIALMSASIQRAIEGTPICASLIQ